MGRNKAVAPRVNCGMNTVCAAASSSGCVLQRGWGAVGQQSWQGGCSGVVAPEVAVYSLRELVVGIRTDVSGRCTAVSVAPAALSVLMHAVHPLARAFMQLECQSDAPSTSRQQLAVIQTLTVHCDLQSLSAWGRRAQRSMFSRQ